MALTLVVEDGSGLSTANSYATEAQGDSYHDGHLYATSWTGATSANKEAALVMATRLLDENIDWTGRKFDEDQALDWPRSGTSDRDGYAIDHDEIPASLANATAELARWLIDSDRTAEAGTEGFRRLKADTLEMEIDKTDRAGVLPRVVVRMIRHLGRPVGGIAAPVVRT